MFVIKYRKVWFGLSVILIALSFYFVKAYGVNLSIDFKGGSITELSYEGERPEKSVVESEIKKLNIGGFSIRASDHQGTQTFVIRTRSLTNIEIEKIVKAASNGGIVPKVERSNTIGPIAGTELQSKALKAIMVVIIMIVLFVTFAFRGVSPPTGPGGQENLPRAWKYGFATIIALFHDVIIPTGVFVLMGHLVGVEIDLLFVTGLLAILGYSVHDTIVVFDRVRENLKINQDRNIIEDFELTVGKSVSQTFARSINTSLTIFITLLALYIFGSSATKDFSLLLLIGVIIGTYSSIFVASPLLVTFYKFQKK